MENSLTDQIVEKIRTKIADSTWKIGEYIPPMRTIAETEHVSRGVVTAAISILVGEGILERVPRQGIKVAQSSGTADDAASVKELAKQCMEVINRRRTGQNNACRTEDLEVLRKCFSTITDEELESARQGSSLFITREDAMLYDKGIRCAGWSPDRFTLYRCNLTNDVSDLMRGALLNFSFDEADITFDDRTMDYVEKRVHPNNANDYLALMNSQFLIEKANEAEYFSSMEYRERVDGEYRWVRLSLTVSKEGESGDTVLYLLYQDIDTEKRNELMLKERTDEDALTGALNRRAFMLQAEQLLDDSDESRQHAFLMLDIDGFKAINDMFGHPVGDSVLSDLSKALHTILRHGDIFGRVGGDEFMICLKDIPFDAVIERKAAQINELMRRSFDNGATISGSIGIVVYPRDGKEYDKLYGKMDMALYHAKESGKDRYEFYQKGMTRSENGIAVLPASVVESELSPGKSTQEKKKILIVDDVESNRTILAEMLKDDYTVLQAKDGRRALLTMRRYGIGISAVLLDLIMPGMSGYEVLQNMQREPILKSIPVIVVSGDEGPDREFKAIGLGAMDFIPKPVDHRLLKLRLKNCVNKQENERLRVQNSYLQLQGDEELRYRYIIQNTGTIVIEHDWVNSVFTYDKMISQFLVGTYDHRPLWRILLSDMVAGSMDVKALQNMVYALANSHEKNQDSMKIRLKTITGEKHWFEVKAIKIVDDFNLANKLLLILNDIHDDVMVEERLRNLVEYDSLTGIYNRSAFLERAEQITKQSKSGTWLLSVTDLDCFSVFNHLFGHEEGDKLLIYIARQMSKAVKQCGGVCGRIQADMFVTLHPARKDHVIRLSDARDRALENYSTIMKITACTGRCYVDDPSLSINTILDRAMVAHRTAKNSTLRDLIFTDDMQRKLLNEQKIISSMETALQNEHFCVYFQPIYDYTSKKIITAEALVRWVTEDGRIIPPNEFIPLFEQNGFIVKLDAYVWEKTCQYLRYWLDAGMDVVPVSVNVSRMDIFNEKFVETITNLTKRYDIPPRLLRLEITESAYMKNSEQVIKPIEELQRLGFTIEMDDFGSGFSSLNILAEVPVDILKLDMRFILGDDRHGRKSKIMGHIINMAKYSDIDVIAEGVETQEQADFLWALGCQNMQGFYFSRPVKSTEFVNFLAPAVAFG